MRRRRLLLALIAVTTAAAAIAAGLGLASANPVGKLPPGPVATVATSKGQLVAFALPHRTGGNVWRVARPYDSKVVRQTSEGDIGKSVVLVFRATGKGTTTVAFALTRGETSKAYESRRFTVKVR